MKIKCITCNKKFLSNVVFNQHSCVKAYDEKTLEQLLQEYNSSKKWINVNELPIVKWWIRGQTVQDADLGLASSETGEQFIHIN
jgi:hypothetical protein